MKTIRIIPLVVCIFLETIFSALHYPVSLISEGVLTERVSFKIKGTGHKRIFVTIGIGSQPGSGACCTGVSENSTVSLVANVGDVVYDGKTRKIISKVYKEMEGTTINLADYY